jgi:hypothetical protein
MEARMKHGAFTRAIGLVAAMIMTQAFACEDPTRIDRSYEVKAKLVKTETVIDPVTGATTMYSYWEYADGVTLKTEDRFKKDTPVEQRRGTSRPPVRTVDIP